MRDRTALPRPKYPAATASANCSLEFLMASRSSIIRLVCPRGEWTRVGCAPCPVCKKASSPSTGLTGVCAHTDAYGHRLGYLSLLRQRARKNRRLEKDLGSLGILDSAPGYVTLRAHRGRSSRFLILNPYLRVMSPNSFPEDK